MRTKQQLVDRPENFWHGRQEEEYRRPKTHAEADAAAEARGIEFEDGLTVAEKADILEA